MSKAVLVMEMPDTCIGCRFNDMQFCEALHEGGEYIPDDDLEKKPKWCPLKPLPDVEHNEDLLDEYGDGWTDGWNAFRKAILET